MAYGMAGMPGNQRQIGLPRGAGGFPVVGGGLGGLPVRKSGARRFYKTLKTTTTNSVSILNVSSAAGGSASANNVATAAFTDRMSVTVWNQNTSGGGSSMCGCVVSIDEGGLLSINASSTQFHNNQAVGLCVSRVSGNKFLVTGNMGRSDGTGSAGQAKVIGLTDAGAFSGSGAMTVITTTSNANHTKSIALDVDGAALVLYVCSSAVIEARVLTVDGTAISAGPMTNVCPAGGVDISGPNYHCLQNLGGGRFFYAARKYGSYAVVASVLMVNGNSISASAAYTLPFDVQYAIFQFCVVSGTVYFVSSDAVTGVLKVRTLSVSDAGEIAVGPDVYAVTDVSAAYICSVGAISENQFVIVSFRGSGLSEVTTCTVNPDKSLSFGQNTSLALPAELNAHVASFSPRMVFSAGAGNSYNSSNYITTAWNTGKAIELIDDARTFSK